VLTGIADEPAEIVYEVNSPSSPFLFSAGDSSGMKSLINVKPTFTEVTVKYFHLIEEKKLQEVIDYPCKISKKKLPYLHSSASSLQSLPC